MSTIPLLPLGIQLRDGTRITHGEAANVRRPLANIPVVMHELFAGAEASEGTSFRGQFGFIDFTHEYRLPRHVHISLHEAKEDRVLLPERILVIGGVALTELSGEIVLVGPGSLVDIPPGVPHTWNACPPGVVLPDGSVSTGTFTMVYDYSERTKFFPTAQTSTLVDPTEYVEYKDDLEVIRFPELTVQQVIQRASFVWDREIRRDLAAAG
jgi:hypothetical protein